MSKCQILYYNKLFCKTFNIFYLVLNMYRVDFLILLHLLHRMAISSTQKTNITCTKPEVVDYNFVWNTMSRMPALDQQRCFNSFLQYKHQEEHQLARGEDFIKTIEKYNYIKLIGELKGRGLHFGAKDPKAKATYDEVVRHLNEQFRTPFDIIETNHQLIINEVEQRTVYPSDFRDEQGARKGGFANLDMFFISTYDDDDDESHPFGWDLRPQKPSGRFSNLEMSVKKNDSIEYEESMDAVSSIMFALNLIISNTRDVVSPFSMDSTNRKISSQVVKALSASINKYSSELSESYLRGARDCRKCGSALFTPRFQMK